MECGDAPELLVAGDVDRPSLSGSRDGSAFVAWASDLDVHAARFDWLVPAADVAVDDRGGARVVWAQGEDRQRRISSSRHVLAEGWLDPVRVDQEDDHQHDQPRLDVAPDGTAAVVWESEHHVWARILPADF